MKKFFQEMISLFGYKLEKVHSKNYNFDEITKILIKKTNPIIFDIGASKGSSIERYKKIFNKPIIHSFEPILEDFKIIEKKYHSDTNIFLNNLGVGDKKETLQLNVNAKKNTSSFKNIIPDTAWLKQRSKQLNIDIKDFTIKKQIVKLTTIDDYVSENKLSHIDILKIDTQGFEDKVIKGALKLLNSNKIKFIELELIFSDIYEKPLQIYDIEKILIPNNFRLFGISKKGNLISDYIYQSDFIYISNEVYEYYKTIN